MTRGDGTAVLDPQILVNAHFQSTAPDWRAIYSSDDVNSRLYQQRRAEVLSLAAGLGLAPGSRVLDVGCGPGLISVPLAQQGLLVEAIDSVPEMIQMTQDLAAASGVGDRVVCQVADIMQLPADGERYDLIVAVGITEWLRSLPAAMRELSRVLKTGGFLIVTSQNSWCLQYILDPLKNPLLAPLKEIARTLMTVLGHRSPQAICHARSAWEVRSAASRAGLEIVGIRRLGFGPLTLFSQNLFSNSRGWRIHLKLQNLADGNWPMLRSMGHVYIALTRKPERRPDLPARPASGLMGRGVLKAALVEAIRGLGGMLRLVMPLSARKRLALVTGRRNAPGQFHFTMALLQDFARTDRNGFHRFLWSNHLAYAATYEIADRFSRSPIEPAPKLLFAEISNYLRDRGIEPRTGVQSVFEVGCSMGYLLRYAETDVFPSATILRGLDIDTYAVDAGNAYLSALRSKVKLTRADMLEADDAFGDQRYDVIVCSGVLTYLEEKAAGEAVANMLAHARYVVGIVTLADPSMDNSRLVFSRTRPLDRGLIHNVDRMVRHAGGAVVYSRWEPPRTPQASGAYTLLATPRLT